MVPPARKLFLLLNLLPGPGCGEGRGQGLSLFSLLCFAHPGHFCIDSDFLKQELYLSFICRVLCLMLPSPILLKAIRLLTSP